MSGTLWVVATPIGHLADLSPRAVEVLTTATLICCEDTRRTGRLLQHAGVAGARLAVANEHTERRRIAEVVEVLDRGGSVAIVSDAGTPAISDPGAALVRAVLDAGHDVSAVPGPDAATTALVLSGLPTDRFVFEGFLPRSGRQRADRLAELAVERRTTIVYEAPHRIERTMDDLRDVCGSDRPVAVCRELTKLYESVERGTLGDVDLGQPRGEYVIVLGGAPIDDDIDDATIERALRAELEQGVSRRDASATVAADLKVSKRRVYDLANTIARGPSN